MIKVEASLYVVFLALVKIVLPSSSIIFILFVTYVHSPLMLDMLLLRLGFETQTVYFNQLKAVLASLTCFGTILAFNFGVQLEQVGPTWSDLNIMFEWIWVNIFIIWIEIELNFLNPSLIWVGLEAPTTFWYLYNVYYSL